MVRVRPGVELTWAIFWPSKELIRLDLPTLDRPRKANSGGPSGGNDFTSAAEARNLATTGFMTGARRPWLFPAIGRRDQEHSRRSGDAAAFCPALYGGWLHHRRATGRR